MIPKTKDVISFDERSISILKDILDSICRQAATDESVSGTRAASLLLDQTTPQTVKNGSPQFNAGIVIKEDQWVYLDGI